MDKETENIMVIQEFLAMNSSTEHLSRAISKCIANVEFEGLDLEVLHLENCEIFFEHSYNNTLRIPALKAPYYSEFWTTKQIFSLDDKTMSIEGNSPSGVEYIVKVVGL